MSKIKILKDNDGHVELGAPEIYELIMDGTLVFLYNPENTQMYYPDWYQPNPGPSPEPPRGATREAVDFVFTFSNIGIGYGIAVAEDGSLSEVSNDSGEEGR